MLYQEDYSKRKRFREQSPFLATRKNIYNQRVDNNVAKQFNKIHGNEIKPISHQTHMSDEEGLKKAYDSPNRYYQHRNKLFVAGSKDFPQDHLDDLTLPHGNNLNFNKTW